MDAHKLSLYKQIKQCQCSGRVLGLACLCCHVSGTVAGAETNPESSLGVRRGRGPLQLLAAGSGAALVLPII